MKIEGMSKLIFTRKDLKHFEIEQSNITLLR